MESAEIPYTTPCLVKGKTVEFVPKGSTKSKKAANQNWFVEFFFYDPGTKTLKGSDSAKT